MWNLSSLSRGCGELVNRKHGRLDVYLEAQDYFNWRSQRNSVFVSLKLHDGKGSLHHHRDLAPPKTYSTRRGALVLYSEDLALQPRQCQHDVTWRHRARLRLSTLRDLARAVLAYGQREDASGPKQVEPYLHFLIGQRNRPGNRKIRPGYSARRYLSCLAQTCDPTLLHRLRGAGWTSELNRLPGTSLNSLLQLQTKCDLSEVPRPYHTLPCFPFAHVYQSSPCLEEEDEEGEEEPILDPGESCPVTDDEDRGMQSDGYRPGTRERRMDREGGAESEDPRESGLYVLIALPPGGLEQIMEEAEQLQGAQQVLDRPSPSSLHRPQPAGGKVQGQRPNAQGRPTIDSSQLCSRKSRMTYYGGPLAGARRGLTVKSRPSDQHGSRRHTEPPVSVNGRLQLPPIGSEIGAGLRPMEDERGDEALSRNGLRPIAKNRLGLKVEKSNIIVANFSARIPLILFLSLRYLGNKGKSKAPDPTETSRMEGLAPAARINGDYPISTERRSGRDGGNAGILPEVSSQMEMEGKMVGFIRIRIEEERSQLEENQGKSETPDSTETSRMEGLAPAAQINGDQPISAEQGSGQDGGIVGILPEISSQMGMEGRMVGFIGIRIEEDGNLLEENKGNSEAPDSTGTSRTEGLDQATRINGEYPISAEQRSGRDGENPGILPEISSQMEMEGRTVRFIGVRIEEDGNLLEGGDDQSLKPRPVLQVQPPIHSTRGPAKQRIKAGIRHKTRRSKISSPGTVRGTIPKELKEVQKDVSVGSLLMAPDGEIVRLSWLGSFQSPNGSLLTNVPRQQGHIPLASSVSREQAGLITNQAREDYLPLEGDISSEKAGLVTNQELEDADIVSGSDGESGQSPGSTHMSSKRNRAGRKAFRRGGRRQTDPDGDSSGGPESGTARGAKVGANRRARVNRRRQRAAGNLDEMALDEDGNLRQSSYSSRSHQNSARDSVHEGEAAQGMAHGSTHGRSAVISSLSGWSQAEPNSPSAAAELGELCSLHAADDGHPPGHGRTGRLRTDGHVVAGDSGTDADDQDAELRNQLNEGSAGFKAEKQRSKRKKGQKNSNGDPNAQDSDSVPSNPEEPRSSLRSNRATGLDKPSGPRSSLGSNQESGLNKPSEPRNSVGRNQESGLNKTSGSRGPPGPNNERSKNNGRAEFVVGRPKGKRAQQQRHQPQPKQNEGSKLRKKGAVRGNGQGDEDEEDTEHSSEGSGPLPSTRRRNTPTSGSTVTATAAAQDPNSHFTDTASPARDRARWRGEHGESPVHPQGVTPGPGSRYPTQSGGSRLENEQRPEGEQQDGREQRRRETEQRIQQELDDDRRRKEQEIRYKRQQHEREALQQQEDVQSQQLREQREREREHRQQEEYRRKVQEMQQRKKRSLAERAEEVERLQRERQKQQEEEEELLKGMDEPQRQEYLRMKQIKEEQEKEELTKQQRKEGERRESLMQAMMQEAVYLLRQKGLMERDLTLSRNLWVEFIGLERAQTITRPWVFSYFELIEFLGLQKPVEEEMEKSSHSSQWD
ncbi:uncharacterized protein KIAA2012 homolog [Cetorhinus maximus]